jgi:hypothetical protein
MNYVKKGLLAITMTIIAAFGMLPMQMGAMQPAKEVVETAQKQEKKSKKSFAKKLMIAVGLGAVIGYTARPRIEAKIEKMHLLAKRVSLYVQVVDFLNRHKTKIIVGTLAVAALVTGYCYQEELQKMLQIMGKTCLEALWGRTEEANGDDIITASPYFVPLTMGDPSLSIAEKQIKLQTALGQVIRLFASARDTQSQFSKECQFSKEALDSMEFFIGQAKEALASDQFAILDLFQNDSVVAANDFEFSK